MPLHRVAEELSAAQPANVTGGAPIPIPAVPTVRIKPTALPIFSWRRAIIIDGGRIGKTFKDKESHLGQLRSRNFNSPIALETR